jgi:hypothetical protein
METAATKWRAERENETLEFIPGNFAKIDKGGLLTHEEDDRSQ